MQNVPSKKGNIKVHWKINKNPLEKNLSGTKSTKWIFKSFSKKRTKFKELEKTLELRFITSRNRRDINTKIREFDPGSG